MDYANWSLGFLASFVLVTQCVGTHAQTTPAPTAAAPSAAISGELQAPSESALPPGPRRSAILEGKELLTQAALRLPENVGNGLNCTNCHLDGGTRAKASPWIGIWGVFPEYRSRSGRLISLQQRVNDCLQRSMNGRALDENSPHMISILAYMQWLSTGVPTGQSVAGRGFGPIDQKLVPDAARGRQVFDGKCGSCHGPNGLGIKAASGYAFPPLWGPDSFNDGAGMARTYTAAAFVKHNMPLGQGGTLSDQEAVDVAEFFTHQSRPVFAGKSNDWPKGDKPKDARN